MPRQIEIIQIKEEPVLSIRESASLSSIPEKMGLIFSEICSFMNEEKMTPAGPPFARWHSMKGEIFDMECGFPVSEPAWGKGRIEIRKLPGGKAVVTLHIGPYDMLADTYKALELWMNEHGYHAAGDPWESYLTGPSIEPSKIRTMVFWPVE